MCSMMAPTIEPARPFLRVLGSLTSVLVAMNMHPILADARVTY